MRIIFAGTPEIAATHFAALINSKHQIIAAYTQPDRPAGRGRKLTASAVKQLALQHNIPVHQPEKLNSDEQEKLRKLNADLMVVVAYGLIIPQAILNAPKFGCINVHVSLLPRWRGAAPIQYAILKGDKETGVSIMQMDAGLDTGDILLQTTTPISEEDTSQSLHDKLAALGATSLLECLENFSNLTPKKQDNHLSSYAGKIKKTDAKINWQQNAIEIDCQIRAFNPWPIAFTELGEHSLRIWQAKPLSKQHDFAPGTIISSNKNGIEVATGNGVLQIQKLQLAGGKPLAVSDFLNAKSDLLQSNKKFT